MKWIVQEQPERELVQSLVEQLNLPTVIAKILVNRRILTPDDANYFFKADWHDLHDPFLMKDMDRAVDRVIQALENKERIFIYGDYDVDGITAVSLLTLFFRELDGDVLFYIPDRLKEGYGLSIQGVENAEKVGATLMITADCGITAIDEVTYARDKGIDVIISDHHEPGATLPEAVAILDPKRNNCTYPFSELAGVGVAFKLIQAIANKMSLEVSLCRGYVDLVALGSAADIVPIIDENRILVKKGLEKINHLNRLGINALIESSGISQKNIGTGQIVFMLAPRINAVGRLGNAERAVRLLTTDSPQQAKNIAAILEKENKHRKNIDEETFLEAQEKIDSEYDEKTDRAVVLSNENWHSGVIGIVASRIAEKIYRPTIMITSEDGIGKGSARSIAKFDIYSAIKLCEDKLISFGGHKYAAGLTIELKNIPAFREAFKRVAIEMIDDDALVQSILIDAEISLADINDKMIHLLNYFAPFGPQNMRPVFLSKSVQVVGTPRIVGKNHLRFRVRQGSHVFDAIGFNLGDLLYRLNPGENNLDMVYVIEENHWKNQIRIQLRVKDLR